MEIPEIMEFMENILRIMDLIAIPEIIVILESQVFKEFTVVKITVEMNAMIALETMEIRGIMDSTETMEILES